MTRPDVYQSRWGFHACDRETFLEIKEYHRFALRDRKATRRREQWSAKLPHNRVCKLRDGTRIPRPEPRALGTDGPTYSWVVSEYGRVRRPQPDPEDVQPLDLPRGWRDRLAELRAFYDGQ